MSHLAPTPAARRTIPDFASTVTDPATLQTSNDTKSDSTRAAAAREQRGDFAPDFVTPAYVRGLPATLGFESLLTKEESSVFKMMLEVLAASHGAIPKQAATTVPRSSASTSTTTAASTATATPAVVAALTSYAAPLDRHG